MKTTKSVLFCSVVKALCNNIEVVKLINKYGHGVSYDLVEKIETEYALNNINKERENRVVLLASVTQEESKSTVTLMVADNIKKLRVHIERVWNVPSRELYPGHGKKRERV